MIQDEVSPSLSLEIEGVVRAHIARYFCERRGDTFRQVSRAETPPLGRCPDTTDTLNLRATLDKRLSLCYRERACVAHF